MLTVLKMEDNSIFKSFLKKIHIPITPSIKIHTKVCSFDKRITSNLNGLIVLSSVIDGILTAVSYKTMPENQ